MMLVKSAGHLAGEMLPVSRTAQTKAGRVRDGAHCSWGLQSLRHLDFQEIIIASTFLGIHFSSAFGQHSCEPHWALAHSPGRSRAAALHRGCCLPWPLMAPPLPGPAVPRLLLH